MPANTAEIDFSTFTKLAFPEQGAVARGKLMWGAWKGAMLREVGAVGRSSGALHFCRAEAAAPLPCPAQSCPVQSQAVPAGLSPQGLAGAVGQWPPQAGTALGTFVQTSATNISYKRPRCCAEQPQLPRAGRLGGRSGWLAPRASTSARAPAHQQPPSPGMGFS